MIVERLVSPRAPLPLSTLRVLTICTDELPELLCAAFLPAPEGSVSTAYFDLDAYQINYQRNAIGEPLAPDSDGALSGVPLPELPKVIATCLRLHRKLSEHLQISWDVILASRGPVYLEGNVFPPGCDYKLSLFKNDQNFDWLKDRILGERNSSRLVGRNTL